MLIHRRGKCKWNCVAAASLSTAALPPCSSMMVRTIASPSPVEPDELLREPSTR